jgi:hypothetical protein
MKKKWKGSVLRRRKKENRRVSSLRVRLAPNGIAKSWNRIAIPMN